MSCLICSYEITGRNRQTNDLVLEEVSFEVKVVGRNIFMWFDHIERIEDARLTVIGG